MRASMLSRAGRLAFASAVVVLPTVVLLSATAEATGAGISTTRSVLTAAKRDIGKQTSVHLAVTSSSRSTSVEEHIKADLGTVSGIETISEGSETVVLKVTPSYGYLSGDSSGLTKIFGMTSAQAKEVGKDWVSVKAGTSQYKDLAASITVSSVVGILPAVKGTKLSTAAPPAKKLYTLKWDTAATSSEPASATTLTVSAVGATLPVLETTTALGTEKETLAFSDWGEQVVVSTPPAGSTIPFSKVSA